MSSSSGIGAGLTRARGRALVGGINDPMPRREGFHCHCEMALPLGNQTHGTIANMVRNIMIVISFTWISFYTSLARYISNFSYYIIVAYKKY
jgi:hypothetical protein